MIVLDENITKHQAEELRAHGLRCRRIGEALGHVGIDDLNDVLPLLHRLRQPTFLTGDSDFHRRDLCHPRYCLVFLDVPAPRMVGCIRHFLRHPRFRTAAQRMGCVVRVSMTGITYRRRNDPEEQTAAWEPRAR